MRVAEMDEDELPDVARAHPWTESDLVTPGRYYNSVKDHHLIRVALEDFKPWEQYRAIESFYELLEFLNGPGSLLETSDCMFRGIVSNTSPQIAKELNALGRLMLLYRNIPLNTSPPHFRRLYQAVLKQISQVDAAFEWGAVVIGAWNTRYSALSGSTQWGRQMVLKFWAWGDSEAEAMDSLDRVFQDLRVVLSNVCSVLAQSP